MGRLEIIIYGTMTEKISAYLPRSFLGIALRVHENLLPWKRRGKSELKHFKDDTERLSVVHDAFVNTVRVKAGDGKVIIPLPPMVVSE